MSRRNKRNNQPTVKHSKKLFWFLAGIVAVSLMAYAVQTSISSSRTEAKAQLEKDFTSRISGHITNKATSAWWLKNGFTGENHSELIEELDKRRQKLTQLVEKYKGTNELSKKIAAAFPVLKMSLYTDNGSMQLFKDKPNLEDLASQLEVCFIPATHVHDHPSLLYYKADWQAVMVSGVEYPEAVVAGILIHELGHAYYHQVLKTPSSTAVDDSELYRGEEVTMHELETAVFDAATNNRFSDQIRAVLERNPDCGGYQDAVKGLTAADLKALDKALGAENCGQEISSTLNAQYMLAVGFAFIDQSAVKDKRQQKINCYRWLRTKFSGK